MLYVDLVKKQRKLLFLHVPKTAGVAVTEVLYRSTTRWGSIPRGHIYAYKTHNLPFSYPEHVRDERGVHCGIADLSVEAIGGAPIISTVRNPFDWYRSWYWFNRKRNPVVPGEPYPHLLGMTGWIARIAMEGGDFETVVRTALDPSGLNEKQLASTANWPFYDPEMPCLRLDYLGAASRLGCGLLTVLTIRVLSRRAEEILRDGDRSTLDSGLLPLLDADLLIPSETLSAGLPGALSALDFPEIPKADPVIYGTERPNSNGYRDGTRYARKLDVSKELLDLIALRESAYLEAFGYETPGGKASKEFFDLRS